MKTTALLLIGFAIHLSGFDVIVPGSSGNAENVEPFTFDSFRYQQVYSANAFSSLQPAGGVVTGLWFKVVSGSPLANGLFQIDLSTTTRPVDGLSTIFGENIGPNNQVVFGPAAHNMIADNGPLGVRSFLIPLSTPYYYNPNTGNLLLDVRMTIGYGFGFGFEPITYSVFTDVGDPVSRVSAFGINSVSGNADSIGLATAFGITPVPEPGTLALIATAVLAFFIFGLRKNQPTRKE